MLSKNLELIENLEFKLEKDEFAIHLILSNFEVYSVSKTNDDVYSVVFVNFIKQKSISDEELEKKEFFLEFFSDLVLGLEILTTRSDYEDGFSFGFTRKKKMSKEQNF